MEFNPKWNNRPNFIGAHQQSKIKTFPLELNFNWKNLCTYHYLCPCYSIYIIIAVPLLVQSISYLAHLNTLFISHVSWSL